MAMDRVSVSSLRRGFSALGLLACAAAVAGCGSSGTGSGAAAGPSASAGASTSASAAPATAAGASASASSAGGGGGAASTSAGSGSGSGSSSAATCLVRYLHGDVGLSQGAAGSVYVEITFKNLNNAACTLSGFPGVSLGGGTPVNQIGQPADRDHSVAVSTVTLAPGGFAHATLRIADALNYPASTCKPASTTWLLVYPPNTSNLLYVPYSTTACTGNIVTLSVQAVQPGNGG
jgi:hypothetical protein